MTEGRKPGHPGPRDAAARRDARPYRSTPCTFGADTSSPKSIISPDMVLREAAFFVGHIEIGRYNREVPTWEADPATEIDKRHHRSRLRVPDLGDDRPTQGRLIADAVSRPPAASVTHLIDNITLYVSCRQHSSLLSIRLVHGHPRRKCHLAGQLEDRGRSGTVHQGRAADRLTRWPLSF